LKVYGDEQFLIQCAPIINNPSGKIIILVIVIGFDTKFTVFTGDDQAVYAEHVDTIFGFI